MRQIRKLPRQVENLPQDKVDPVSPNGRPIASRIECAKKIAGKVMPAGARNAVEYLSAVKYNAQLYQTRENR